MVDVAPADVVVVLTRAPASGGKSRLFAALERPPDPALLEALLLDTIDGARSSGARLLLAVTPAEAAGALGAATGVEAFGQAEGDIGARMREAMRHALGHGGQRVALIGSDLPAITGSHVRGAFSALDSDPAALVLGPALDGGYYLIAATRLPPVFDNVRWGSASVLEDTRTAASRAGVMVHLLEPLQDVDGIGDLQRLTPASPRSFAWALANGMISRRGSAT